jgi:regulator of cell morphogenesis and NO signaling
LRSGGISVGEVCVANKIDTATFLAVVNFLAEESVEINESPENISLETVVNFLKNAHSYFLSYKLPAIRERLYEIVSADDVNHSYRVVLLKFFDEYVEEVKKHKYL